MPGEPTATGVSHGREARKNRENEGDAPGSEKLGSAMPTRGGPTLGEFPWEALGIADLKVV